ncbi:MAG TPA: MarR family transcriptional regulator [Candidatus Obscuribacterales bacterium]
MQDHSFKPQTEQGQPPFDDDEILFAEETETSQPAASWKILIVDDEAEVHDITQLALADVTFAGRALTFLNAYSAQEAQAILQTQADIAIVLLDVVMETEDAGLQLITYIRETLGNLTTRIIVRTGQPGQAPEDIVVVNYGINDYRLKTELTARKLFIAVITALRAFSTITQVLAVSQRLAAQLSQGAAPDSAPHAPSLGQLEQALRSLQTDAAAAPPPAGLPDLDLMTPATPPPGEEAIDTLQTMSMVSRIARMALRIVDGQSTQMGISQTKLAVLMYLSSEPGQCASPSTLATYCGVSRAAMTGLLDGLTQENYVERDTHPSDRRAVMIKLTPAGHDFLEQVTSQQYQLSELLEAINETERRTLIELVIQFIRLLDVPTGEPMAESQ